LPNIAIKKSREKENARNRKKKEEKLEGGKTVTNP